MHLLHKYSKFQAELSSYIVFWEASLLLVLLFECGACARHEMAFINSGSAICLM
ncbi:BgTH12-01662 [Blumeria graminis f. sp. triticale]|uniref:BgTH12-01662 n=1 Tax=Blumeria graminis f. sp. triticale TaxID=1689686 RepID=A0A9W4GF16_BLUGR|nr:BgTH12-01662 [Blumeria graminis f. sp. triticale]